MWTDDGALVHDGHPDAQHSDLEICAPDGARVGEVTCNYGPTDTDNPDAALAGARASAELFAHASADLTFLLDLLNGGDRK
ncbi:MULTISPECIES: hypothetical protein [unclassified Streptomyces]|uniref:hypothetical protein n=1 Tax=unclassified Streptomyces TaxID=2593676 RepID=UPI003825DECB